jgi:hypothetical protein
MAFPHRQFNKEKIDMSDKKKITEAAKEFQKEEKGGADSSKQFAQAAHDQRADSGARKDGGKEETEKPAPDWAETKTESGVNLFPPDKTTDKE